MTVLIVEVMYDLNISVLKFETPSGTIEELTETVGAVVVGAILDLCFFAPGFLSPPIGFLLSKCAATHENFLSVAFLGRSDKI
jgi:hypothetical protein